MGYKVVTIDPLVVQAEDGGKRQQCTTENSIQWRNDAFVNEPSTDVPATNPSTERTPTVEVHRLCTKG